MSLSPSHALALALDPALILAAQGIHPDPWQRQLLLDPAPRVLLNCSRQGGKSTAVAALALHTALVHPRALVLLLSPSQRQSHELFRKVLAAYHACGRPVPTVQDAQALSKLELANGSRVVGLPGKEQTVRSFSSVTLLVIDEASRVPDDLYRSVRPMLAVSRGRLVALSTPFGQRGWFYDEWHHGTAFARVLVPWDHCPRITADTGASASRAEARRCTRRPRIRQPGFGAPDALVSVIVRVGGERRPRASTDIQAGPGDTARWTKATVTNGKSTRPFSGTPGHRLASGGAVLLVIVRIGTPARLDRPGPIHLAHVRAQRPGKQPIGRREQ